MYQRTVFSCSDDLYPAEGRSISICKQMNNSGKHREQLKRLCENRPASPMLVPSTKSVCEPIEGCKRTFGSLLRSGLGLRKKAALENFHLSVDLDTASSTSENSICIQEDKLLDRPRSGVQGRVLKNARKSVTFAHTDTYLMMHSSQEYDRKSPYKSSVRNQSEANAVYVELMTFKMLEMPVHNDSLENTARHLGTPGSAEELWKCWVLKKILSPPVHYKY